MRRTSARFNPVADSTNHSPLSIILPGPINDLTTQSLLKPMLVITGSVAKMAMTSTVAAAPASTTATAKETSTVTDTRAKVKPKNCQAKAALAKDTVKVTSTRGKTKSNTSTAKQVQKTKAKQVRKPKANAALKLKPSSTNVAKPRYAQHSKSTSNQRQIKSLSSTVKGRTLKAKPKKDNNGIVVGPKVVAKPLSAIKKNRGRLSSPCA